jgi:predicted solute-binding protein
MLVPARPDLETMLDIADAAVIIGDPALRLNRDELGFASYDLGELWTNFSGKPMVYAMWSGKPDRASATTFAVLDASYRYGKQHLDSIIASETERQGLPADLISAYLRENIKFELGELYAGGLDIFYRHARDLSLLG